MGPRPSRLLVRNVAWVTGWTRRGARRAIKAAYAHDIDAVLGLAGFLDAAERGFSGEQWARIVHGVMGAVKAGSSTGVLAVDDGVTVLFEPSERAS